MLGAIIGDIVGSRFEFDQGDKSREFEFFTRENDFTDDTVMSIAVAEALLDAGKDADEKTVKDNLIKSMKKWGKKYPHAGYGARFIDWVLSDDPKPYGSYGNGSGMRVSAAGWLYDSIERTREVARWTAEVTHNHPEGVKGAESVAAAIFMARNGASFEEIHDYIVKEFGYDLSRTLDEIRPKYYHVEDCMHTMPEAFECFLESESYESCLRNVMYIGGDTDTLGAIAGAIAEAFWGIPVMFVPTAKEYLTEDLIAVLDRFEKTVNGDPKEDPYALNKYIKMAAVHFRETNDIEDMIVLIQILQKRMTENGEAPTPMIDVNNVVADFDPDKMVMGKPFSFDKEIRLRKDKVKDDEGNEWFCLFTDFEEVDRQPTTNFRINCPIRVILEDGLHCDDVKGVVINPFGQSVILNKKVLEVALKIFENEGEEKQE